MILGEGLFQADGHPGNILVQRGGRVALLDYGQSKQLEESDKLAFADLILAMNRCGYIACCEVLLQLKYITDALWKHACQGCHMVVYRQRQVARCAGCGSFAGIKVCRRPQCRFVV